MTVLSFKKGRDEVTAGHRAPFPTALGEDYETVAASQTTQNIGVSASIGDHLARLIIVPTTTSPGIVQIKDGTGTAITVFPGGASSVATLAPIEVPLGLTSTLGPWQVTTGANVSVIAIGYFSSTHLGAAGFVPAAANLTLSPTAPDVLVA